MPRTVPYYEPDEVVIGETLEWKKRLSEYPAGEGWVLTYYFRAQSSGAGFDQAAAADGNDFKVTVPAATTAAMSAGPYNFQAWVAKGAEKYIVESGRVTARAGFTSVAAASTVDLRSNAKKIVDAIDAYFAGGAAAKEVQSYQIGSRTLARIPDAEKITLRDRYARIYSAERRAERLRDGAPFFQNVLVRFDTPS